MRVWMTRTRKSIGSATYRHYLLKAWVARSKERRRNRGWPESDFYHRSGGSAISLRSFRCTAAADGVLSVCYRTLRQRSRGRFPVCCGCCLASSAQVAWCTIVSILAVHVVMSERNWTSVSVFAKDSSVATRIACWHFKQTADRDRSEERWLADPSDTLV